MIYLVLLALVPLSWASESGLLEPPLWVEMPPPPSNGSNARNVFTSWMPMPVDHFDPQNRNTFLMRFMFNEQFFGGEGFPIFIMIGGEWAISSGWLQTGNMFEMARENRGYQIYTEHRYYGQTLPFPLFTTENLRFLNVDQALADLAHFITELKQVPRFAQSKVILYGGSYAANMALWFKQRYPHLAVGGVASSGPIKGQVDFTGYLEVVHDAFLSEGGEQCIATIRQGIEDTVAAMSTETGRRRLEQVYHLCQPLNYNNPFELGYFSGLISWTFSTSVQTARPGSLTEICRNFTTTAYGLTPMERISGYITRVRGFPNCWLLDYESYIASYSSILPTVYVHASAKSYLEIYKFCNKNTAYFKARAWYYQTCTEYGYYQTAPRNGTVFDPLVWLSVEFYVDVCKRAYDVKFDEQFVYDAVERVNLVFGGIQPDVNNTINIHGALDPWRALGVYDRDLKASSPTITVPRASHCFDMRPWGVTDTIRMTNAQQTARRLVASWISSP